MQDNLGDGTRRVAREGGMNRIVVQVAAPVKDRKNGRKDEHGGDRERQNTVAEGRLGLRAGGRGVVIAERAALSESGARANERGGENNSSF